MYPILQPKPPLAQLEAIPFCPITSYLQKEADLQLPIDSFQVVAESNKVSPEPPLLQTKQPQFPQATPHGTCNCEKNLDNFLQTGPFTSFIALLWTLLRASMSFYFCLQRTYFSSKIKEIKVKLFYNPYSKQVRTSRHRTGFRKSV